MVICVTAVIVLIGNPFIVALPDSTIVLALLKTVPVMLDILVCAGCGPDITSLSTRAVATIGTFRVPVARTSCPRRTGILLVGSLIFRLFCVITILLDRERTVLTRLTVLRPLTPMTMGIRPFAPVTTLPTLSILRGPCIKSRVI